MSSGLLPSITGMVGGSWGLTTAAGAFSVAGWVCAVGMDLEDGEGGGSLKKKTRQSNSIKKEMANAASTRFSWSTEGPHRRGGSRTAPTKLAVRTVRAVREPPLRNEHSRPGNCKRRVRALGRTLGPHRAGSV